MQVGRIFRKGLRRIHPYRQKATRHTRRGRKLRSYQQVKAVSREYDVNWGGTSVLESEMHLLRMAVQRSDADYYHLISGQDTRLVR